MKQFICTAPKECREVGDRQKPVDFDKYADWTTGSVFQLSQSDKDYAACEEYEIYLASLPRYPILSSKTYEVGEEISGTLCYQYFVCGIKGERESEWLTSDEEFCKKYFPNDYRVSVQTLESFLEMSDEEILNKIKEIKGRLSIRTT